MKKSSVSERSSSSSDSPATFCFESPLWSSLSLRTFYFTTPHRHVADAEFYRLLERVRLATEEEGAMICDALAEQAKDHGRGIDDDDDVVHLRAKLSETASINEMGLKSEPLYSSTRRTYTAEDEGSKEELRSSPSLPSLELCVGCKVLLIKNLSLGLGLINGSMGRVERFTSDGLPIVNFAVLGEDGGMEEVRRTIRVEEFTVSRGGGGKGKAATAVSSRRLQIPLIHGYALSVHKCQGMTLSRASIDLRGFFEFGQAYVAISRVRGREGLSFVGKGGGRFCHWKVRRFYQGLEALKGS